jgi:tetratricopeptide (TPR) repeat protein
MVDPTRHGEAMQLAMDLVGQGRVESAFGCVDVLTDAALLEGDWSRAIEALQAFVGAAAHVPALIKLVELCVDAAVDGPLRAAQAQLADAYLASGSGAEARVIAEDLLAQEPENEAHAARLRRALELLGVDDAEQMVRDVSARHDEDAALDLDAPADPPIVLETVEVDLSDALSGIGSAAAGAPAASPPDPIEVLDRGLEHLMAGREDEAMVDLQEAVASPRTRARAAAELGRLHVRRGDAEAGVVWLELAADGPAASPEETFEVLYDLADALQRLGESARALAILIDLDADAGAYRDVRSRIEDLARSQAGSKHG